MLGTILILIVTVVVVPLCSFFYGTPLNVLQSMILEQMLWIVGGVVAYSFIVGQLARNNSQTDKLWSVVPIFYTWYMSWMAGMPDKMVFMSVIVSIWGARLTFNFARRGGYSWKFWAGEEDYRWEVLRQKPGFSNPIVWAIFDLFFICGYQHALIFLFTLPILFVAGTDGATSITLVDWMLGALIIACIVIEFIADQQQYDFQTEKYRRKNAGEDLGAYAHGFVRTGLWKYMRHPNYAMEQSVWLIFYFFSVSATGAWINWSATGCLLLVVLFKSSSDFSEALTAAKYPEYKDYQKKTPRFIPFTK
jgi:steroid 5-alpha reductase family enzyme